jgi:hypothetical protein
MQAVSQIEIQRVMSALGSRGRGASKRRTPEQCRKAQAASAEAKRMKRINAPKDTSG